jgi:SAM-dependent methyltransferase
MLRIARTQPGAAEVTWIEGEGQSLDLMRRFDLVYMTGHAFQALLSDDVALGVLEAAARHLAPGGRFAFQTRNPARRAWLSWTPELSAKAVQTNADGAVEETTDASHDPATGIVALTHRYRFLDQGFERVGHSRIRFIAQAHLERLLAEAGLAPQNWYGGWDGQPLAPDSPEIIVLAGRAPD